MKRILVLSLLMLFVAASVYASSGRLVMPYWWMTAGMYKASPVVFCAHYPTGTGTADVTLKWYSGAGALVQTNTKNFNGAGHQRWDRTTQGVGFACVEWASYDGGVVGCTGIEWYGTAGSLYHVPFVQ